MQLPEIQGGEWIIAFEGRGRLSLELLHLFELLERHQKRWQSGLVGVDKHKGITKKVDAYSHADHKHHPQLADPNEIRQVTCQNGHYVYLRCISLVWLWLCIACLLLLLLAWIISSSGLSVRLA